MGSIPTPDHQRIFRDVWADIVTINGRINEEFLARELYDFRHCMIEARAVYQAVARIDRPDADAQTVLAHAAYEAASVRISYLRSQALVIPDDQPGAAELREQLWRIAAQWETQRPAPPAVALPAPPAWMTTALAAAPHRWHDTEYELIWRAHLLDADGALDEDKVAQVLAAYWRFLETVPLVYSDLANLSKPNTAAHHVIDGAEEQFRAMYADFLCDEAYPLDEGPVRDGLIELAMQWHPTAWDEHMQGRRIVAALSKNSPTLPEDAAAAAA